MLAPPAEILGRDHEIEQISARLLRHHGCLLTLVGPPGVGKTRLAQLELEAGQRLSLRDAFATILKGKGSSGLNGSL